MKKIVLMVLGFTLVLGTGASALVANQLASNTDTSNDAAIVAPSSFEADPEEPTEAPKEEETQDEPKDDHETDVPKEEPTEEPKDEEPYESKDEERDESRDEPKEEPKDEEPSDTTPPAIHIISPDNGATVHEAKIRFTGETEPGAKVFVGDWYADVTDDGHWSLVLILEKGSNTVKFTAKDAAGNRSVASTTVTYEPVIDEPDEKDYKFTANQKYGSCGEEIPYDFFWGTAKPGATIYVESPYGGGTTTAGDKGNWEIKVKFPEAPAGTFGVVIESSDGGRAEFSFTVIKDVVEKVYEFTANHKWEASEEPWNVYWGTGTPGIAVHVTSDFGSGVAEVNDDGHWELKVTFDAPANTPFKVTVSNGEKSKTFTFKHKVLVE